MLFSCPPASAIATDLFYEAYASGCEAAEQQRLELVYNLGHFFDGCYPADLLVFVLRELNPRVLLQIDAETGRRDWPWLSEKALATLEAECRHYAGRSVPAHETELHALLSALNPQELAADPRPCALPRAA